MDAEHAGRVIRTALANAEAAAFPTTKRIEHAIRSVMQRFPEISADEAVIAVGRVRRGDR